MKVICDHAGECKSRGCNGKQSHAKVANCKSRFCDGLNKKVKCVEVKKGVGDD